MFARDVFKHLHTFASLQSPIHAFAICKHHKSFKKLYKMGYNTSISGQFNIDKVLEPEHKNIIKCLNSKRHNSVLLPSCYCQWIVGENDQTIIWDGKNKFYSYEKWIALIVTILEPLGYKINGKVFWIGENRDDRGTIIIKNNTIKIWSSLENASKGNDLKKRDVSQLL
jgi:hypothetical protein